MKSSFLYSKKIFNTFFTVLFLLMSFCTAHSQKRIFDRDSVILIVYNQTVTISNYSQSDPVKLLIDSTRSYYFITNPRFEKGIDPKQQAYIAKVIDSNYVLFNSAMLPKYDRFSYFSDSLHPMKWELNNHKIQLNGRVGYGATTFFRGRYYTAYYDPNIPFSNGPVKFGGLPGLIIKLFDKDKIWDFELVTIQKEARNFKGNQMRVEGDYQMFLSLFPAWLKRRSEKEKANQTVDPNCPQCGSELKSYTMEIYD